jgi:hypothetical protein
MKSSNCASGTGRPTFQRLLFFFSDQPINKAPIHSGDASMRGGISLDMTDEYLLLKVLLLSVAELMLNETDPDKTLESPAILEDEVPAAAPDILSL